MLSLNTIVFKVTLNYYPSFFDPTYILFLGESNKSLYMVTNEYLISSIFNSKKKKELLFLCIKVYLMLLLIIVLLGKFIFMSLINNCIYIIITVSHNSM